jgi:comEA protein
LNRGIKVLQTSALPLGYDAVFDLRLYENYTVLSSRKSVGLLVSRESDNIIIMWRKLLSLLLLLLLLLGLAWWSQERSVVIPAKQCEGSPVLLTYQGREALWCLESATPVMLAEAAEVTGACRESLLSLSSLTIEHLTLKEDGRGCVIQRASIPASQRFVLGMALNINEASQEDLESLPGVGPSVAKAIIEDRSQSGPFPSIEALDRVKGIGPKAIERLREFITVENQVKSEE